MVNEDPLPRAERWARFRFAVLGPLLAAPPGPGELAAELARLADREYEHPLTRAKVRFSAKTLERWYYLARGADRDPVTALRKRPRRDRGGQPSMSEALITALRAQYRAHPSWSTQLHYDNLRALVAQRPELGSLPSYSTVRRFMLRGELLRRRRSRGAGREGFTGREVRSYEVEQPHALWHLDFHQGSLKTLLPSGEWLRPKALGIIDDHSRLCCHLQWYRSEDTECLVHGLCQAFQRRGLPRALLTDNGSAMLAEEVTEGLLRLGVVAQQTVPYSPYQNGKQEVFWAQLEGRLLAMLEGEAELGFENLNRCSLIWVESEYNRKVHRETEEAPRDRALKGKSLERPCPDAETLRQAFTVRRTRKVRGSDGTISLEGRRFELPEAYRRLRQVTVRYARWDLSRVLLINPETGLVLVRLRPLDKAENARSTRRKVAAPEQSEPAPALDAGPAPLLAQLLAEFEARGLQVPYLPKQETTQPETTKEDA